MGLQQNPEILQSENQTRPLSLLLEVTKIFFLFLGIGLFQ